MPDRPKAVLYSRTLLTIALAVCIYQTGVFGFPASREPESLFVLSGMVVATLISTMIATRSSYLGDRIFFGVLAGTLVLDLVADVVRPRPSISLVLHELKTLAFAGAGVGIMWLLISGTRRRPN
jgi:hypothetical protein